MGSLPDFFRWIILPVPSILDMIVNKEKLDPLLDKFYFKSCDEPNAFLF